MAVDTKVIERIQKLLNLAGNNPNENEAAVAASRVQELLIKYNLEMADVEGHQSIGENIMADRFDMGAKRYCPFRWMVVTAQGVGDVTFVEVLYTISMRTFTFVGTPTDIQAAKELYWWLRDQIERLGEEEMRRVKNDRSIWNKKTYRNNFLVACAGRVSARLREEQRRQLDIQNAHALVRVSSEANKEYMKANMKVKFESFNALPWNADRQAFEAGREAGDRVDLSVKQKVSGGPDKALPGGKD
jgi:hypothetical protein